MPSGVRCWASPLKQRRSGTPVGEDRSQLVFVTGASLFGGGHGGRVEGNCHLVRTDVRLRDSESRSAVIRWPWKPVDEQMIATAIAQTGIGRQPVMVHSTLKALAVVIGGASAVVGDLLGRGRPCWRLLSRLDSASRGRPTVRRRRATASISGSKVRQRAWGGCTRRLVAKSTGKREPWRLHSSGWQARPGACIASTRCRRGARCANARRRSDRAGRLCVNPRPGQPWWMRHPVGHRARINDGAASCGGDVGQAACSTVSERTRRSSHGGVRRWMLRGFGALDPVLSPVERTQRVGKGPCRAFPLREVLALGSEAIASRPEVTRCTRRDCVRCADAVAGGPVQKPPVRSPGSSRCPGARDIGRRNGCFIGDSPSGRAARRLPEPFPWTGKALPPSRWWRASSFLVIAL